MTLLSTWARWRPREPPFVLDEDREILLGERPSHPRVIYRSWREAHSQPDFGEPGDRRLHLGLLPIPFTGAVSDADIYVLLLNPGLGPTDYYGEYERPDFRRYRLMTLRQEFGRALPFGELDPRFAWHGGYLWWHRKLAAVIRVLAERRSMSFAQARERLGRRLAAMELLPYHSASYPGSSLERLPSVQLVRSFVHEVLVPRVRRGEATVIVARGARHWRLPKHRNIITYSGAESRAAHLSPESLGGRALLARLLRD